GSNRSNFLNIVRRVINTPIIASVVKSNPIGNLTDKILQQTIGFKNGIISQRAIDSFVTRIQPYLDFYKELDDVSTNFRNELLEYKKSVDALQSKCKKFTQSINSELGGQNSLKALDSLFKHGSKDKLDVLEIATINNSKPVIKIISLIN